MTEARLKEIESTFEGMRGFKFWLPAAAQGLELVAEVRRLQRHWHYDGQCSSDKVDFVPLPDPFDDVPDGVVD